ncbi:hypothetical protein [Actinacidiphila glaucinigra]|uniref:hypothetical protein n=1 Tax=Actinacidiphila glaucinigra TaxID=235986 RepID=UPI0035DD0747
MSHSQKARFWNSVFQLGKVDSAERIPPPSALGTLQSNDVRSSTIVRPAARFQAVRGVTAVNPGRAVPLDELGPADGIDLLLQQIEPGPFIQQPADLRDVIKDGDAAVAGGPARVVGEVLEGELVGEAAGESLAVQFGGGKPGTGIGLAQQFLRAQTRSTATPTTTRPSACSALPRTAMVILELLRLFRATGCTSA